MRTASTIMCLPTIWLDGVVGTVRSAAEAHAEPRRRKLKQPPASPRKLRRQPQPQRRSLKHLLLSQPAAPAASVDEKIAKLNWALRLCSRGGTN